MDRLERLAALHDWMISHLWKSTMWLDCECGSHWGSHASPMPDWAGFYEKTPSGIYPRFKLTGQFSCGNRTPVRIPE